MNWQQRIVRKPDGKPLDADFDSDLWHEVRFASVSATDINLMTLRNGEIGAQYWNILNAKLGRDRGQSFASFALGIEREPEIAKTVIEQFAELQLQHNRFLFAGENFRHVATPDLIGDKAVGEIKVSTKSLREIRNKYSDQMQWQMHVTGLDRALFIVENRYDRRLETEWVHRDQFRINALTKVAASFLDDLDKRVHDGQ